MSQHKKTFKELTKENIIGQARIQFLENGFQQISMRSIAKRLGCSHGAIYYHFKSKAELFYAVVEDDFSKLNLVLEDSIKGSQDESIKLHNLFLSFIEFGLNNQSQYEFMFLTKNTEVDSLSQVAANQSYQKFAQTVQFLSKKELKIIDIWSAFLALQGFISHYRGYVNHFKDIRSMANSYVQFIINGLNQLH